MLEGPITGADNRSFVQQVHAHIKSLIIALTHGLGVGILASQCKFSSIVNTSQRVLAFGYSAEMHQLREMQSDADARVAIWK